MPTTVNAPAPTVDRSAMTAGPPTSQLSAALGRLATWRVWVPLTAGYAVFAGVFFASSAPFAIPVVEAACGAPPLDVRSGASAADVHAFLAGCGPAGREAYQALHVADLAYPLVFALFLASSLAVVLRRLAPTRPRLLGLAAIPFLAGAFDYLENACAWVALTAYPSAAPTDALLVLASDAKTLTSWLAGTLLIVATAALLGRMGWRRLRRAGAGRARAGRARAGQ